MKVRTHVGQRQDNGHIVEVTWSETRRIHHEGVKVDGSTPFEVEVEEDFDFQDLARIYNKALAVLVCTGLTPAQVKALATGAPALKILKKE